ncbi:MAG: cytochrome C [Betaproteobacteria bacterium]
MNSRSASRTTGRALVTACALGAVASGAAAADKETVTYENSIKKIVAQKCATCHGSDAPSLAEFDEDKEGWKKKMKGPRMDSYANLVTFVKGSDAGAIMRRLDDGKSAKDGKPGNMYVWLGSTDAERGQTLAVFKDWVGDWTLKRRKGLTDSELKKISAREK